MQPILPSDKKARLHELIHSESEEIICGTVTFNQLMFLAPQEWLFDEIMNTYITLIKEKYQDCYVFSSFFYGKLKKKEPISRWTKNVDIFDRRLIIIPIHFPVHWCMCIVDNTTRMVEFWDSYRKNDKGVMATVIGFLQKEWQTKQKGECPQYTPKRILNGPMQLNGFDCGVFALMTAEYRARGVFPDFEEQHMKYFRQKILLELDDKVIMDVGQ